MITVLSGLEMDVEVSALGIGSEEGGVLLGRHIEVLIDLSTLSEFQFQHLQFRSVADARDTTGVYGTSLHAFLDADRPMKDLGAVLAFKLQGQQSLDSVDRMVCDAGQHFRR
jgi:hypothetical protein